MQVPMVASFSVGHLSPRQAWAVKAIPAGRGGELAAVASSLPDLLIHRQLSAAPEVSGLPFSSPTRLDPCCEPSSFSVPSGLYSLYMLLKPASLGRLKQLVGSGL